MKREVKILGLTYSQSSLDSYVCLLGEKMGHRRLPIIINTQSAHTIALKLEGMKNNKPSTHDVIKKVTDSFMIDCREIYIYKIVEATFYCKMVMDNGIDDVDIDVSTGDALSLSVIYECPLYVSEDVLSVCGIIVDDVLDTSSNDESVDNGVMNLDNLERMIQEAIKNEDYELAAELRDKISKLKE
jgi:bifunctional DNase/RNase